METMAKIKLEENIKKELRSTSRSLNQLARDCGIPVSVLHGWANGTLPSARNLHQIIKLAKCLDKTLEELLFGRKLDDQISTLQSFTLVDGKNSYRITVKKLS